MPKQGAPVVGSKHSVAVLEPRHGRPTCANEISCIGICTYSISALLMPSRQGRFVAIRFPVRGVRGSPSRLFVPAGGSPR